ncbi:MAG: hypothetical protein HZB26_06615 [Candidatus Hydrogenedentes bacterium]|nr:hypothetical protein [Candidatus Hydrogenedentota bacterium]
MKTKTFDCVEMKREGGRRIYEALKGKSPEEQWQYWQARNEDMRRWLEQRKKDAAPPKVNSD